jgi:hypothetical protein
MIFELDMSAYELRDWVEKSLIQDCPNKQEYYPDTEPVWRGPACVDGKVRKKFTKLSKTKRKLTRYNYYNCPVCKGKGVVLSPAGEYLMGFMREWS